LPAQPWFGLALFQGIILAVNFFLLAYTAQRAGVAVAALASRLSVAIPALLAFALYGDTLTAVKLAGLVAGVLSLYLCTAQFGASRRVHSLTIRLLPLLVFVTFGGYFTIIKYAQAHYLDERSYHPYVMTGFFCAFLASVMIGAGRKLLAIRAFQIADALAGVLLGAVNYLAVYALVKVLALAGWQSSQLYPVYSVGVVGVSTVLAMILFGERLSRMRTIGLALGLIAVALLNR
jgi:drug/metabolite transporter (DMT)-like permease